MPTKKKTTLIVQEKATRRVPVNKRSVLLGSVRSNGKVTSVRAECRLNGNRIRGRDADRLCGIKIPNAKKLAKGKVRITALPTCSRNLSITATVTSKKPGARAATWTKTWRVDKRTSIACSLDANG